MSFSASCHIYLVSIYDRSMIKASIVNHPFKEIKSVLHSRITRSLVVDHVNNVIHLKSSLPEMDQKLPWFGWMLQLYDWI
jgi:hypothetical protein